MQLHWLAPPRSDCVMGFLPDSRTDLSGLLFSVFDSLPDPVFIKNSNHVWIYGNAAFARLLGRDDFVGKGDDLVFPPEQIAIFKEEDRKVFAGQISLNEEKVGESMIALTKKTPIRLPDGSMGLVAVLMDITAYKQTESRARYLEAESAAKSQFLANMSHEIRTPLNGVLGMAQVLAMDGLTPAQQEKLDVLIDSGRTLMGVVNDVLDFTKISSGKMELVPENTDIVTLLTRAVELFRPKAAEKNLSLMLTLDNDLPARASVDSIRLRQCIGNLVSNAIKFTEQGSVTINARTAVSAGNEILRISVTDTGIGMTGEQTQRLFSEFSQVDESSTRRFGGTGLGLAITQRLARLMAGDVTVTSRPGAGSTFVLTVKLDAISREAVASNTADLPVNAGKRILVVDDHPINRRIVSMFLTPHGFEVVEAGDGGRALELLEQQSFDLVLMDVNMPVMDGVTTVRHMRGSGKPWARLPVIALTADAMPGDREKFLAAGMTGYMSKPIEHRELVSAIVTALHDPFEPLGAKSIARASGA